MNNMNTEQVYRVGGHRFTNEVAAQSFLKLQSAVKVLGWALKGGDFGSSVTLQEDMLEYRDKNQCLIDGERVPVDVFYDYDVTAVAKVQGSEILITFIETAADIHAKNKDKYTISCTYSDDEEKLLENYKSSLKSNLRLYYNYVLERYSTEIRMLQNRENFINHRANEVLTLLNNL